MFLKNNEKGVTLVEMLIVVAVMGILLAVGIPSITHFQKTQNIRECRNNMDILQNQIRLFRTGDLDDTFHMCWYAGSYNPTTRQWEHWFKDSSAETYTAYYYNEDKKFLSKDIFCDTPGEYFLRTIYKFNGDMADFEFPSSGKEDCLLYITFVPSADNNTYGKNGSQISALANKNYNGSVVIHCTCPEHDLDEPLTVMF